MNFPLPPSVHRIFNVLLLGAFVLLFSCQSDPIILNPPGGYEYINQTFTLDASNSFSFQGDSHTGYSTRLYSGRLNDYDIVSTLIILKPEVIDSHQVCIADSIFDISLELISTENIAVLDDSTYIDTSIQINALKSYLIPDIYIVDLNEDEIITSEKLEQILNLSNEEITIELKGENGIKLNLFDQDTTILDKICGDLDGFGIIVSYFPTDTSYIEFYSSDDTNIGLGPKLSLEYAVKEATPINYNRYFINSVTWSDAFEDLNYGPYYVNDSLSIFWGTFYAMNLNLDGQIISNPSILYDSISVISDIISDLGILPTTFFQVNVELNSEIINDIDSITFSLTNAKAFRSDADLSGDNQTETNPDNKENNLAYDEGEKFNDYGSDNCPDSLESGQNLCGNSISLYNPIGTENNDNLEWIDLNGNGTWDENEGEQWWDWGIDGCEDKFEFGEDSCGTVVNTIWTLGLDLNGDNFNIDPAQDDWHPIDLPFGTEGNGTFDEGEFYIDCGSDGLPESVMGYKDEDETENNDEYDEGEPFNDTGIDGLFNSEEVGYNVYGTENNNQFDNAGEFNDCGEDNVCSPEDGDASDDYNIDPNNDNMTIDSSFTQGNSILDWIDNNNNGLWDEGEGEQWFDWGIDQIPDSLEAFQTSTLLIPNLYENTYVFDLENQLLDVSPEQTDSTVNLWVSKIKKTENNVLTIDIGIQSNLALKGLQFQLSHIPYIKEDTLLQTYELSISEIELEKLFEDLSLLPKKTFSEEELDGKLWIDYANDISTSLDFDNLEMLLSDGENIISHEKSNLVLYVDTVNTNLYDDIWVYFTHLNQFGEDEIFVTKRVSSLSDSIEISMGNMLRSYQSRNLEPLDQIKLKAGSNLFNYSRLSIQTNARLNVMYTK